MKLYLYKTESERNRLEKVLTDEVKVSGTMRGEFNFIDPTFTLENDNAPKSNYAVLPELARYYFIEKVSIDPNGLYIVKMHLDVLMTYKEQIKEMYVKVTQSKSNPYFTNYISGFDVRTEHEVKEFENNFNENGDFILVALYGKERGMQ